MEKARLTCKQNATSIHLESTKGKGRVVPVPKYLPRYVYGRMTVKLHVF
jgi:hypothetical protein